MKVDNRIFSMIGKEQQEEKKSLSAPYLGQHTSTKTAISTNQKKNYEAYTNSTLKYKLKIENYKRTY